MRFSVGALDGWKSPRSQLMIENWATFSIFATDFWVSPRRRRRFLIWSPRVCGTKSSSFLINALRVIGTPGKRQRVSEGNRLQKTEGRTASARLKRSILIMTMAFSQYMVGAALVSRVPKFIDLKFLQGRTAIDNSLASSSR